MSGPGLQLVEWLPPPLGLPEAGAIAHLCRSPKTLPRASPMRSWLGLAGRSISTRAAHASQRHSTARALGG